MELHISLRALASEGVRALSVRRYSLGDGSLRHPRYESLLILYTKLVKANFAKLWNEIAL
jgi:hypothetical protein